MSSFPEVARGRLNSSESRKDYNKHWDELTQRLNSAGYGQKPKEGWQKCWTDYKHSLKKKAAAIEQQRNLTGGGPASQDVLTEHQLKILGILGQTFFKGVGVKEFGITGQIKHDHGQENKKSCSVLEVIPQKTSSPVAGPSSANSDECKLDENKIPFRRNKRRNIDHDYLPSVAKKRKMSENQLNSIYCETLKVLKEINTNLENIGGIMKEAVAEIKKMNTTTCYPNIYRSYFYFVYFAQISTIIYLKLIM